MTAGHVTRAEICVLACAEAWRNDSKMLATAASSVQASTQFALVPL
jgi:hypothetical protein